MGRLVEVINIGEFCCVSSAVGLYQSHRRFVISIGLFGLFCVIEMLRRGGKRGYQSGICLCFWLSGADWSPTCKGILFLKNAKLRGRVVSRFMLA